MAETRIEDVVELNAFSSALQALGYRSVEQVLGTAQVAPEALASYLNIELAELQTSLALVPLTAKRDSVGLGRRKHKIGARLDNIEHPNYASTRDLTKAVALPSTVNFMTEMPPMREQGERGTCVAHATTAMAEHYWSKQNKSITLSRQFLYWNCKQHDGSPNGEGTWMSKAMERLAADGCCPEEVWPYVPGEIKGNESQDPPQPGSSSGAHKYKIPAFQHIPPTSLADIKTTLAEGRVVAFCAHVFNSWYLNDEVYRTGEIVNSLPGERSVGGHAMCFVGYEDDPDDVASGGGKFYVRNSWGDRWATESVLGSVGYGTIPYRYIVENCKACYAIG